MESRYNINLIITDFKGLNDNSSITWIELLDKIKDEVLIVIISNYIPIRRKHLTKKYLEQLLLFSNIIQITKNKNTIDKYLINISKKFREVLEENYHAHVRYVIDIKIELNLLNKFLERIKKLRG